MSTDDLRALVMAVRDLVNREREDRLREAKRLEEALKEQEGSLKEQANAVAELRKTIVRWTAPAAAIVALLVWIGPDRLPQLLSSLFSP